MLRRKQFEDLRRRVEAGITAGLTLDVGGKQYRRLFRAEERVIVLGGGALAPVLCASAVERGFSVAVVDDRPEQAHPGVYPEAKTILCGPYGASLTALGIRPGDCVICTRKGHLRDAEVSVPLLAAPPALVIAVGPPERLEAAGEVPVQYVPEDAGAVIQAMERRRETGERTDRISGALPQEEIEPGLLRFLGEPGLGKALIMVYAVEGEAPVRPGAVMAVDEYRRVFGALGGGAAQRLMVRTAFDLIGTGRQETMRVRLDSDFDRAEHHARSGAMSVILADVAD